MIWIITCHFPHAWFLWDEFAQFINQLIFLIEEIFDEGTWVCIGGDFNTSLRTRAYGVTWLPLLLQRSCSVATGDATGDTKDLRFFVFVLVYLIVNKPPLETYCNSQLVRLGSCRNSTSSICCKASSIPFGLFCS